MPYIKPVVPLKFEMPLTSHRRKTNPRQSQPQSQTVSDGVKEEEEEAAAEQILPISSSSSF
ncbi:hypothetical protein DVH24_020995 [Malus domestica]|uniref:Uncharacterized protein n=1 Tax=Malus domestica TaxID=3750 RepID=A0A498JE15_MALDO|nr:hypothetical protein DVH24_020995 [Malus domestica]